MIEQIEAIMATVVADIGQMIQDEKVKIVESFMSSDQFDIHSSNQKI